MQAAFSGLTTAYAYMRNSVSGDETRTAITTATNFALTPAGSGTYTVRVADAATGGNVLWETSTFTVAALTFALGGGQPTTGTTSAAITFTGTYTGTAPGGFTYSWNASGGSGTVSSSTISGGTWSATFPCSSNVSTTAVCTITEVGGGALSVTTGNINVSAPVAFAITSIAPQAIGVAGASMVFNAVYTGTWSAPTVTVDGVGVTLVANNAGSGGVGTFTITAPAPSSFTGTALTQGPLHTCTAVGSTGSTRTTTFAANASANYPGNLYAQNPEQMVSSFTRTGSAMNTYVYLGTSTTVATGTPTGSYNLTNNGNNAPTGTFVNVKVAGSLTAIRGLAPSLVVPPGTVLPAATGYHNGFTTAASTNSNAAFDFGGQLFSDTSSAGTYYAWLITSDGYCYVRPTGITVS